jgi:peptidyl-prolyl cis-trans isomerase D
MAAIGRIRKHSGLLLIVIGIALLAFILGDFVRKGQSNSNNLATVGGQNISWNEFETRFKDVEEKFKQQSGKDNFTPEEVFQLREYAWNMLLRDFLQGDEYKKLGIEVTEEEMTDLTTGKNPDPMIRQIFSDPETGAFNPARVQEFIQNKEQAKPEERRFFDNMLKDIKTNRYASKYNYLVAKSYYLPKPLAKKMYEDFTSNASLRVIQVNYKLVDDKSIKLSDDDYKKWYDGHKYMFEQPEEVRDLDYVIFDVVPTQADLKAIDEEVVKLFKEFQETSDPISFVNTLPDAKYDSTFFKKGKLPICLDSLAFSAQVGGFIAPSIENNTYLFAKVLDVKMRPDSVKASHILIQYEGARGAKTKRTKEDAKRLADSIMMQTKKATPQFANFALQFSDYPTVKKDSGDLNWMADGDPNFQLFFDSLYILKNNDIRIVETALGYHVMMVTGQSIPEKKVRLAIAKKAIEASEKTIQDIYSLANKFASENENTTKFNQTIVKQGLAKRTADNLKAMEYTIPGVKDGREVIRWAYDEKSKKDMVSQVFDVDGKYIVATLKEVKPKGFATLEQVKPLIESLVKRDKKAEQLIEKVKTAMSKSSNPDELATQFQSKVDTVANFNFGSYNLYNYGPELDVIGTVSTMKPGQVSKPLKGNMGVYVVYYDQFNPAPPTTDYKMVSMQMANMFGQRVGNEAFNAIQKNAKIKDYRVKYY